MPFLRTAAHIFVSPGDAPAIITQYVAWIERRFNACQTPCSMYPSILNSFRVIRCLIQCLTLKIGIFTTFLFPLGTPLAQSRYMLYTDGKEIRCVQFVSLHVRSNYYRFWDTARYMWKKSSFYHTPLHSTPPLGGFSRNIGTPFGTEKLEWCRYPTVKKFWRYVYSFWRDPRTWQTDRQTSCHGIYALCIRVAQ